jgi:hypothetical protein
VESPHDSDPSYGIKEEAEDGSIENRAEDFYQIDADKEYISCMMDRMPDTEDYGPEHRAALKVIISFFNADPDSEFRYERVVKDGLIVDTVIPRTSEETQNEVNEEEVEVIPDSEIDQDGSGDEKPSQKEDSVKDEENGSDKGLKESSFTSSSEEESE